jgi:NTP pyrophosphatase (non-canonical NTP hydrolase)
MNYDIQPAINILVKASQETDDPHLQACYKDAVTDLSTSTLGGFGWLVDLVRQWGLERNIIGPNAKATVDSQFAKLLEEVDELGDSIRHSDQHGVIDGIGDATVVLILLANLAGVRFEQCLLAAYDEIKERKGKMVDGKFVRQK